MHKILTLFIVLGLLIGSQTVYAQNPRASNYQNMPLMVNPALTGHFEGIVRVSAHQAFVYISPPVNNFTNISADMRVGYSGSWAMGMNYFTSNNKYFQQNAGSLSFSVAREFYLDNYGVNSIRLGAILTLNKGFGSNTKGYTPAVGGGALYHYENTDVKFEAGLSAYNLKVPEEGPFFPDFARKVRIVVHQKFSYDIDYAYTLRFNALFWNERFFRLTNAEIENGDDKSALNAEIIGIGIDKKINYSSLSFQVSERSFKSLIGTIGFHSGSGFQVNLTYEQPVKRTLSDVKRFELGFTSFINR